jgi:hypothetical protein
VEPEFTLLPHLSAAFDSKAGEENSEIRYQLLGIPFKQIRTDRI